MSPIDVAYGALLEVGRPDLAECIAWFDDNYGGFIEVLDEVDPADEAVIDKAENLARASVGLPPTISNAYRAWHREQA